VLREGILSGFHPFIPSPNFRGRRNVHLTSPPEIINAQISKFSRFFGVVLSFYLINSFSFYINSFEIVNFEEYRTFNIIYILGLH
jgi:hypothetical protein